MSFANFYRLKRLPPYVFAEVNALKQKARAAGRDVIDFGMGNPDLPPNDAIVKKLVATLGKPKVHRYSASKGITGLRKAVVGYYQRRFGVTLDADNEAIVTIGSKEGLVSLANAFTAPGDIILVPNPCYPIHTWGFILAGASVKHIPIDPLDTYISRLDAAARTTLPKPVATVISFPANPTAQTVSLDFYKELVAVCKKHEIWLISDLAYSEIYYGQPSPSVLQVAGAKDICIEFTTMSKTFSMAGWRVGFACGNPTLVGALGKIKSYTDYGAFTPLQVAAAEALNHGSAYIVELREQYRKRRDTLARGLQQAGWNVTVPDASMFIWAAIPEPFRAEGSLAFAKRLIAEADVAVAPGIGFGEYGDGHVRFALIENQHRIRQACRSIKTMLQTKKT